MTPAGRRAVSYQSEVSVPVRGTGCDDSLTEPGSFLFSVSVPVRGTGCDFMRLMVCISMTMGFCPREGNGLRQTITALIIHGLACFCPREGNGLRQQKCTTAYGEKQMNSHNPHRYYTMLCGFFQVLSKEK